MRTAWNAFWVGLGASAVLIGQTVLAPHAPANPARAEDPSAEPAKAHEAAPLPERLPSASNASPNADTPVLSKIPTPSRCTTKVSSLLGC